MYCVHTFLWLRLPQARPPQLGSFRRVRVRSELPCPHVEEQVDHVLQLFSWQSTGQQLWIQLRLCDVTGHAALQ